MKKRTIALIMALVLVFGAVIGGTIAYLTTSTDPVTNTFVAGDIGDLTLTETKDEDSSTAGNQFIVVPGKEIEKDPMVAYDADTPDVAVYVFIKVTAEGWAVASDNVSYTFAIGSVTEGLSCKVCEGWTFLEKDGSDYIYYKTLAANTDMAETSLITGDKVTVSANVTKAELQAAIFKDLSFTAYAIQQESLTAEQAWAALNN